MSSKKKPSSSSSSKKTPSSAKKKSTPSFSFSSSSATTTTLPKFANQPFQELVESDNPLLPPPPPSPSQNLTSSRLDPWGLRPDREPNMCPSNHPVPPTLPHPDNQAYIEAESVDGRPIPSGLAERVAFEEQGAEDQQQSNWYKGFNLPPNHIASRLDILRRWPHQETAFNQRTGQSSDYDMRWPPSRTRHYDRGMACTREGTTRGESPGQQACISFPDKFSFTNSGVIRDNVYPFLEAGDPRTPDSTTGTWCPSAKQIEFLSPDNTAFFARNNPIDLPGVEQIPSPFISSIPAPPMPFLPTMKGAPGVRMPLNFKDRPLTRTPADAKGGMMIDSENDIWYRPSNQTSARPSNPVSGPCNGEYIPIPPRMNGSRIAVGSQFEPDSQELQLLITNITNGNNLLGTATCGGGSPQSLPLPPYTYKRAGYLGELGSCMLMNHHARLRALDKESDGTLPKGTAAALQSQHLTTNNVSLEGVQIHNDMLLTNYMSGNQQFLFRPGKMLKNLRGGPKMTPVLEPYPRATGDMGDPVVTWARPLPQNLFPVISNRLISHPQSFRTRSQLSQYLKRSSPPIKGDGVNEAFVYPASSSDIPVSGGVIDVHQAQLPEVSLGVQPIWDAKGASPYTVLPPYSYPVSLRTALDYETQGAFTCPSFNELNKQQGKYNYYTKYRGLLDPNNSNTQTQLASKKDATTTALPGAVALCSDIQPTNAGMSDELWNDLNQRDTDDAPRGGKPGTFDVCYQYAVRTELDDPEAYALNSQTGVIRSDVETRKKDDSVASEGKEEGEEIVTTTSESSTRVKNTSFSSGTDHPSIRAAVTRSALENFFASGRTIDNADNPKGEVVLASKILDACQSNPGACDSILKDKCKNIKQSTLTNAYNRSAPYNVSRSKNVNRNLIDPAVLAADNVVRACGCFLSENEYDGTTQVTSKTCHPVCRPPQVVKPANSKPCDAPTCIISNIKIPSAGKRDITQPKPVFTFTQACSGSGNSLCMIDDVLIKRAKDANYGGVKIDQSQCGSCFKKMSDGAVVKIPCNMDFGDGTSEKETTVFSTSEKTATITKDDKNTASPEDESSNTPYYIVGGVLGGLVLLGCIAGGVAYYTSLQKQKK